MATTAFLDANIFMYAAGASHPHKDPCVGLLLELTENRTDEDFVTNTEVLQEILHRYRSIGKPDMARSIFELVVGLPIRFLPIRIEEMIEANALLQKTHGLSTRDAVHAATLKRAGISRIYSYDRNFDHFRFLERREPKAATIVRA